MLDDAGELARKSVASLLGKVSGEARVGEPSGEVGRTVEEESKPGRELAEAKAKGRCFTAGTSEGGLGVVVVDGTSKEEQEQRTGVSRGRQKKQW